MSFSSYQELLRQLPQVHRLLQDPRLQEMGKQTSPAWVSATASEMVDYWRNQILNQTLDHVPDWNQMVESILQKLEDTFRPHLQQVINATGIVLHTNLGRAVLSPEVLAHMKQIALSYSNLEYQLNAGTRGSRYDHVKDMLCQLTGSEDAMVVNNNAAAVFLVLRELAKNKEVLVSRGQLVEIGGSFRVSEIMTESGAILVEVGTTNKTHPADYISHISINTALLLKVHTSNFKTIGFTEEVPLATLVEIGRQHEVPVYEDLGSGVLMDLRPYGIGEEPTVQEVVQQGADIVSFSGDKLLGGPQAGIIVGKKKWISRLKKNQLTRALRVDKLTLSALEATLQQYFVPELAIKRIPTLSMILLSPEHLKQRATHLSEMLQRAIGHETNIEIQPGKSEVGGGSLPGVELPTWLVTIVPLRHSVNRLEHALRLSTPPLIGRIAHDQLVLDVRTMLPSEDQECVKSLVQAISMLNQ